MVTRYTYNMENARRKTDKRQSIAFVRLNSLSERLVFSPKRYASPTETAISIAEFMPVNKFTFPSVRIHILRLLIVVWVFFLPFSNSLSNNNSFSV